MTKKPCNPTQFLSGEMLSAKDEFNTLYDKNIEMPREYLERKRSRDMRTLILYVVENELDEARKVIFKRVFLEGEKINDVAQEMGICPSNVYKHYYKALKKIEQNLKYVVFYQNCCRNDKLKPLEVMKEYASSSLRMASSPAISMRLFRLMQKNNVNTQKLCECIGMREKRFRAIFQGEEQLTADEIALLSGFFGVTTDYILKGESD